MTASTYGIVCRNCPTVPGGWLPATPPPVWYRRNRTLLVPRGGTRPFTLLPKATSPVSRFTTKCRSSCVDDDQLSTSCQLTHASSPVSSPSLTSTHSSDSTGVRAVRNV